MELKACERCGGKIRFQEEKGFYVCLYCKSEFKREKVEVSDVEETKDVLGKVLNGKVDLDDLTDLTDLVNPEEAGEIVKKAKIGCLLGSLIPIAAIIAFVVFFLWPADDGPDFSGDLITLSHHSLLIDIPDTIYPRSSSMLGTPIYFADTNRYGWIIAHDPGQVSLEGDFEAIRERWFNDRNVESHVFVGTPEVRNINGNEVILQETRGDQGRRHMHAFIFTGDDLYVLQYHSYLDGFDVYYPHFLEILESVRVR